MRLYLIIFCEKDFQMILQKEAPWRNNFAIGVRLKQNWFEWMDELLNMSLCLNDSGLLMFSKVTRITKNDSYKYIDR